jgi:hypothetical protein
VGGKIVLIFNPFVIILQIFAWGLMHHTDIIAQLPVSQIKTFFSIILDVGEVLAAVDFNIFLYISTTV